MINLTHLFDMNLVMKREIKICFQFIFYKKNLSNTSDFYREQIETMCWYGMEGNYARSTACVVRIDMSPFE